MPPDRKSHLIFHRCAVAEAVKEGVESAGGSATIFQYVLSISSIAGHYLTSVLALMCRIAETLPAEVLTKLYAPAKPNYPIITPEELVNFDAFLFGIPTRYGNFPAQWKVRFFFSLSLLERLFSDRCSQSSFPWVSPRLRYLSFIRHGSPITAISPNW